MVRLSSGPVISHVLQRLLRLPPAATRELLVERGLRVAMRDGSVLLADRWFPRTGGEGLPVALLRSPYGRDVQPWVRPLAERGFQVVVQSTRGTFGSDGPFAPFRRERDDGLDTLDWILGRRWAGASIVLVGGSYLGYAQWAVADAAPPQVRAMIPTVSESALTLEFLRADGFALETPFGWGVQTADQERRFAAPRQLLGQRRLRRAHRTLPLSRADAVAVGRRVDYLQDILAHDAADPFWAAVDHRARVRDIAVPASLVAGWYDIFLPGQLRDFRVLQDAGRSPRLTVGPWSHLSFRGVNGAAAREALEFGLPLAQGGQPVSREPVRLFVMQPGRGRRRVDGRWRDFPSWPPPGYRDQRLHLQPGGRLAADPPPPSEPDGYRYDPADPTPAAGGARLSLSARAGGVDNRRLEARPDVLTYTSAVLEHDVEAIGEVRAEVWFRSSRPSADVFVRLCDVDGRGRSWNVCDGLTTVSGAREATCVAVGLWPTAHRFARGHRLRVQVSSGAFPRYNRNPGAGEPRADAATLHAADQQVLHDPQHPSALLLPVAERPR